MPTVKPKRPSPLLLLLAAAFALGVAAGSLFVNALPPAEKSEVGQRVEEAINRFRGGETIPPGEVFHRSAAFNLKTALVIWLLGMSTAGIPLIMTVLFVRGFVVGFTVGFLFYHAGGGGLAFVLASIMPANLVAVPALLAMGTVACAFALFRRERGPHLSRSQFWHEFARYSVLSGGLTAILALASALDGYAGWALTRHLTSLLASPRLASGSF